MGELRIALVHEADALRRQLADAQVEIARLTERRFPIMGGPSIPWSMIAPYERQALRNHNQTLERLAERGGLSPLEAVAVMEGRRLMPPYGTKSAGLDRLRQLLGEYEQRRSAPTVTARPIADYDDDDGNVLWWRFPVEEPPYVGTPGDSDWPGYHTHWTPLPPVPSEPKGEHRE